MVLMTVESTNSNARIDDGEIAPTVIARSGTGGGNVPIALLTPPETESQQPLMPATTKGKDSDKARKESLY